MDDSSQPRGLWSWSKKNVEIFYGLRIDDNEGWLG